LNVSGAKRAKRLGTFGLTSYGALGAEQMHPISPLSTTFTFGPIDDEGRVCIKIIYDHRVLDGAYVARRLRDVEEAMAGPIFDELRAGARAARLGNVPPAA
jgi:pyruvate/2-oxoglutarate dehydrogenase complex dihydrolipoamide acyltransferase (E2) component